MHLRRLVALLRRPASTDAGLAALLFALSATLARTQVGNPKLELTLGPGPAHLLRLHWWMATALACAALLVRRRLPVPVLVVTAAAALVHMYEGFLPAAADCAALVAMYTVALHRRFRFAAAALGVVLVVLAGYGFLLARPAQQTSAATTAAWVQAKANAAAGSKTAAWPVSTDRRQLRPPLVWGGVLALPLLLGSALAVGRGSRDRQAYVGAVEERARALARERDRQGEVAAAAERARIARELHDVVAHGLSVIVVQAQGAAAALDAQPDRSRQALDDIVSTGRASLAEMRRLLGVVRQVPGEAAEPAYAPQPGLAGLPTLVDTVRRAGTAVELTVEGVPRPLPAGVDLSAYRLVQEGLTNAIKHAGAGARTQVRLRYGTGTLDLEVTDTGVGAAATAGAPPAAAELGRGLRGMRERVAMLGGELSAGPDPAGGYRLRARLPVDATAS